MRPPADEIRRAAAPPKFALLAQLAYDDVGINRPHVSGPHDLLGFGPWQKRMLALDYDRACFESESVEFIVPDPKEQTCRSSASM